MSEVIEPTIYVGVLAERFKAHDIHTDDEMFYVPERTCNLIPFVEEDGSVLVVNCSNCDAALLKRANANYCPNCGAKVVE